MKNLFILLFLVSIATSFGQEFEMLPNVKLETEADFTKHEADVLKAIIWLEKTSVETQKEKRKLVSAFVLEWIIGTPTVSIALQSFHTDLSKKNSDLLLTFMGGWVKESLENPSQKDNALAVNLAGVQSVIAVYSLNKGDGMKKDKKIEKLIGMNDAELNQWIQKQLE